MASSVVRAMRILDLLAHADRPAGLSAVADKLEMPRSTTHKILQDLVAEGFVTVVEPHAYTIGLKAFEVGAAHLHATGRIGAIAPELIRLTRSLDVTSHYAVLDAADAVYLCKEDPPGRGIQVASTIVGSRLPAYQTAVGKACLAWLPQDRLAAHPAIANLPASAVDRLKAELTGIRDEGYAIDEGESTVGVRCVAAPVFDLSGPCGAIGTSYLLGADRSSEQIRHEVTDSAARVTTLLGGTTRS